MSRHGNSPKHIIRIDVGIVIVNLVSQVSRCNWTGINVQSNKGECAPVLSSVRRNEMTLIEAHIHLEGQVCGDTRDGVGSYAATQDARDADKPAEIGNVRRIVYVAQRHPRSDAKMMNEDSERG